MSAESGSTGIALLVMGSNAVVKSAPKTTPAQPRPEALFLLELRDGVGDRLRMREIGRTRRNRADELHERFHLVLECVKGLEEAVDELEVNQCGAADEHRQGNQSRRCGEAAIEGQNRIVQRPIDHVLNDHKFVGQLDSYLHFMLFYLWTVSTQRHKQQHTKSQIATHNSTNNNNKMHNRSGKEEENKEHTNSDNTKVSGSDISPKHSPRMKG
jgi:hypothetical protein